MHQSHYGPLARRSCYPQSMSNSDILSKADRALRPVLKELGRFPWIRIEGCCAGHKQEDTLWLEINVLGASGLQRLMELLRVFDAKLAGTDCRVDCLLSYSATGDAADVPHGWIPTAIEVFWPPKNDWRRSQSMIIETLLSSIEESSSRLSQGENPTGAIIYCPFCSSSFIRIEAVEKSGNRYRCGDCDAMWTMIEPAV
jgi:predicted RNA-binding Zn-ribbon protein involved in translation (DUF1610 family)